MVQRTRALFALCSPVKLESYFWSQLIQVRSFNLISLYVFLKIQNIALIWHDWQSALSMFKTRIAKVLLPLTEVHLQSLHKTCLKSMLISTSVLWALHSLRSHQGNIYKQSANPRVGGASQTFIYWAQLCRGGKESFSSWFVLAVNYCICKYQTLSYFLLWQNSHWFPLGV